MEQNRPFFSFLTTDPRYLMSTTARTSNFDHFNVVDYCVFSSMLILSAVTGMYFGCKSRYCSPGEKQTVKDYLTGSRKLKAFPVAMSMIASYVSGVTVLGTPAEIYVFGSMYTLITIAIVLSGIVIGTVYLPVFFTLEVESSYEYLRYRFNSSVRIIACSFFLLDEILFLPMVIYVPSLAFNQVSGINIHIIGSIVCVICIFYTVLGGLKAVVWTDTWQIIAMFLAVVVVALLGTIQLGGPEYIYSESDKGGRLNYEDFTLNFSQRYTYLSVLIGGFTYWTSFNAVHQTMVQRYMSLPTLKESRKSLSMFIVGTASFVYLCCYCGNLIYAYYKDCDPLAMGRIKTDDQMLPLYVMETVGHLRGVPGLFIAGVFGAALSSLSVILNSTAIVILEDFMKGAFKLRLSEKVKGRIAKGLALGLGTSAILFVFIIEKLGGVLEVATALSSIAAGTTFGLFTLGMLFPWANSTGAIAGSIAGILMSAIVSFGNQYTSAYHLVVPHRLPISVEKCEELYGVSVNYTEIVYPDESGVFPLFKLSYFWITPIGVISVLVVGIIVSLVSGSRDLTTLDPDLISPVCQWMLPEEADRYRGTTKARRRDISTSL